MLPIIQEINTKISWSLYSIPFSYLLLYSLLGK